MMYRTATRENARNLRDSSSRAGKFAAVSLARSAHPRILLGCACQMSIQFHTCARRGSRKRVCTYIAQVEMKIKSILDRTQRAWNIRVCAADCALFFIWQIVYLTGESSLEHHITRAEVKHSIFMRGLLIPILSQTQLMKLFARSCVFTFNAGTKLG